MVGIAGLAEEVLHSIMKLVLTISWELFTSPSDRTFGENDTVSSASIVLVCKQWLRVATPLLYETIILRSSGQSRALKDVFQKHKTFAKRVKNLRLEGAYPCLKEIMPLCTNMTTFVLLLEIYSDTPISSLCKSLPLINPTEVILREIEKNNANCEQVLTALSEAVPTWKNLVCPFL